MLEFVKCPLTGVAADDADAFENYVLHAGADRSAFDRPFEIELEDMAQAESVRARLMRLLAPLAVFGRTRAAAEEYSKAVTDFFNGCDFVKNNAALVSRLQESDPAQAMVNDQSVAELAAIVTAAEEVFGEDKISPKVYAEVLSSAVEARQVSTVPLSLDCVYVGQVGESRYENCKYMFVVGASLGKLPAESADTGLLSDSDCAEWGRFDAPVHPNARERGLRYKLSALMTLLKPEKKLYVSYCTSDKAGNKTQPSAAMNEIASLLDLKINFFREMPEAIVSRAALARYLGGAGNAKGALISFVGLKRDNIDVLSREDLNALYSYVSEKFGAEYVRNLTEGKVKGSVVMQLFDPMTEKVVLTRKQKFEAEAGRNAAVKFSFEADERYDLLGIRLVADGGTFSDGEQHLLPVLSNKQQVVETQTLTVRGKETRTFGLDSLFNGNSRTATDRRLTVEFTGNPAWYAVQALPTMSVPETDNAIVWATAYYANALAGYIANSQPRIKAVFDSWKATGASKETFLSQLEKNQEVKNILQQWKAWRNFTR